MHQIAKRTKPGDPPIALPNFFRLKFRRGQKKPKQISIAIDNYGDLFSDFNHGPYSHGVASLDFESELFQRLSGTKETNYIVNLVIPKKERNKKLEGKIVENIVSQFQAKAERAAAIARKEKVFGILLLSAGIVLNYFHKDIGDLFRVAIAEKMTSLWTFSATARSFSELTT